ncbi:MAG: pseudaminic acid cytidylyltransferase [Oligoflexales bacterium]|nr:pseudaminic acid cytidylyltransferase [Oligoflexales bacterium]
MCIAIIPARGGSKRIPGKNIRFFLGKPILYYPINAALESGCFKEVMVSTDDEIIAEVAISFGASVPFLRSKENSNDFASTSNVLLEVLHEYEYRNITYENLCCFYPTSVFVDSNMIRESKVVFDKSGTDGLISVVKYGHPIQRSLRVDCDRLVVNHPESFYGRTQDCRPMYHDAAQLYWLKVSNFLKEKKMFCENCVPYFLSENIAQDIDNEDDWVIAELKYRHFYLKGLLKEREI